MDEIFILFSMILFLSCNYLKHRVYCAFFLDFIDNIIFSFK